MLSYFDLFAGETLCVTDDDSFGCKDGNIADGLVGA